MKINDPVPIFFGHIERGFGKAEARAVDQHQTEISALDEFGYEAIEGANVLHPAEIGTNYVSFPGGVLYRLLHFKKLLVVAADQDDFCPCTVVRKGELASNTLAGPRDNCQAAIETKGRQIGT